MYAEVLRLGSILTAKTGTTTCVFQTAVGTPIYPQGFVSHELSFLEL